MITSQATRPTDDQLFFCPARASSRRLWAGAGERRRRASERLFAAPPVATRNGLAPPPPRGAPVTPENLSEKACENPGLAQNRPQIMVQTQITKRLRGKLPSTSPTHIMK